MRNDHSINNLQVSLDVINTLKGEFDELINSKRLKSQITTIGELIRVLWNRNLFYSDANTKNLILTHITCNKQKDVIHEYIKSLVGAKDSIGPQNVYGNIFCCCFLLHMHIIFSVHFHLYCSKTS